MQDVDIDNTMNPIPRAEVVGSLKRPARLIAANRAAYSAGHVSVQAEERQTGLDVIHAIADAEIPRIVARQIESGLDVVSDGEFRRYMFLNSFFDGIEGFTTDCAKARFRDADGSTVEWNMQLVSNRLRQVDNPGAAEAAFLSRTTDHLFKVAFPAGSFLALPFNWRKGVNDHAYESHRALVEHAVEIEKSMIAGAIAAGCRYIQFDFSTYPFLCDAGWCDKMRRAGFDWQETLELCEWADREVIAGIPSFVRTGIHLCRGNHENHYVAEGSIDPVAERFFALPYDSFLVEWDESSCMGDFSALQHLPAGNSVVVLGIVNTKSPRLERAQEILRRLDDAARLVGPERLALSTQCGFASTLNGNRIDENRQWAKLSLVGEVASAFWEISPAVRQAIRV